MTTALPRLLTAATLALCAQASSTQALLHQLTGPGFSAYGHAVVLLGDVDGDGLGDYALGDPYDNTNGVDAGLVELRSGADHSLIDTVYGGAAGDLFGWALAGPGDVDGDGVPDWAASSPRATGSLGVIEGGRVVLHSGATSTALFTWRGTHQGHKLGEQLFAIDDLDGDGLDDILYDRNDVLGSTPGLASVRSSATGAVIHELFGNVNGEFFAGVIAPAGDMNADGLADIAVTALRWMGVYFDERCQVYSGDDGTLLHDFGDVVPQSGPSAAWTGPPIAPLGDVDGDGYGDLAVGDSDGISFLDVRVFSGATGAELWSLPKPAGFDHWGRALLAWPDLDGDGIEDLAIAAPAAGGDHGRVRIVSGVDGATLHDLQASLDVKQLGGSMARGPDLSGDGVDDVLMACTPGPYVAWPAHVRVVSGVCDGEVLDYGAGLAGSGGFVPTLGASGCPAPGVVMTLSMDDGVGSANATLLLGLAPLAAPFKGGTLLVDPAGALLLPVFLSGGNGVPGAGSAAITNVMPDEPLLTGLSIFFQLAVPDGGAPKGIAFSSGQEWRFG
jgi:hypothetical protein